MIFVKEPDLARVWVLDRYQKDSNTSTVDVVVEDQGCAPVVRPADDSPAETSDGGNLLTNVWEWHPESVSDSCLIDPSGLGPPSRRSTPARCAAISW